jgi:hypothetical protein
MYLPVHMDCAGTHMALSVYTWLCQLSQCQYGCDCRNMVVPVHTEMCGVCRQRPACLLESCWVLSAERRTWLLVGDLGFVKVNCMAAAVALGMQAYMWQQLGCCGLGYHPSHPCNSHEEPILIRCLPDGEVAHTNIMEGFSDLCVSRIHDNWFTRYWYDHLVSCQPCDGSAVKDYRSQLGQAGGRHTGTSSRKVMHEMNVLTQQLSAPASLRFKHTSGHKSS